MSPALERWLQRGLVATALAALAAAWWFPDAISRSRRWGQPYAEAPDPCGSPCVVRFADGAEVAFAASPQPAGPGTPIDVAITTRGVGAPLALEVQGAEMAMGFVRVPFAAHGDTSVARVDLPICTTSRMRWRADVVFADRVAGFTLWSER